MHISPMRTGVALGGVLGAWHFLWSIAVAIGAAQAIVDFIFWMHFLELKVAIAPFDWAVAAVLVVVTSLIGFALGYGFAAIWNWLHQERVVRRPAPAR